jgi:hypothetical protein
MNAYEQERRKAQAILTLHNNDDSSVAWLLIHLAKAVEKKNNNKPISYDISYVKKHLEEFMAATHGE